MDNVIKGPWTAKPTIPQYTEDEKNAMMVQALVEEITDAIFEGLDSAGFDNLEDLCYSKNLALIAESLRSFIFLMQERYHPMQDVADQAFDWKEDGTLKIQPSLNVDFLPDDYC